MPIECVDWLNEFAIIWIIEVMNVIYGAGQLELVAIIYRLELLYRGCLLVLQNPNSSLCKTRAFGRFAYLQPITALHIIWIW